MHSLRAAAFLIGGLSPLLPAPTPAQELDGDDKRFLKDVRPIILPDERALFEGLEDKADRLVFQKIFWARRDPDLATPKNEFGQQYVKDRKAADRRYSVPRTPGSATDCGRLFILLGEPDEIKRIGNPFPPVATWSTGHDEAGIARQSFGVVRQPQTWVYKDRPDRRMATAREKITFNAGCRAGGNFAQQLDRMAATKIVHPNIDYKVGADGHLVRPADQFAGDTPSPMRGSSARDAPTRGSSRHP